MNCKYRIGNEQDTEQILGIRPYAAPVFAGNSYFLVAEEDGILGFAAVFRRDIPAPVPAAEAFINVIEVFEERDRKKGIASGMVQKIMEIERAEKTYQIRAYCDVRNAASHRLWFKNGFGISPVTMQDEVVGSFVTYVL